ncbi:hypothetical protein C7M84_009765 [Penaeus vannamei]|uniref:Uncharacterized protein n=1 Tax=Penaeus vannamei TaxID=6689 RepID=A0A3R7QM64_PENVA|nr:hypothetical protein C7M84_009765 [Penaeus vannamei]
MDMVPQGVSIILVALVLGSRAFVCASLFSLPGPLLYTGFVPLALSFLLALATDCVFNREKMSLNRAYIKATLLPPQDKAGVVASLVYCGFGASQDLRLQEPPAGIPGLDRADQPGHPTTARGPAPHRDPRPPAHSRCRPLAPDRCRSARAEFDLMMQLGIIRPSSSQWAAPLHLVKKDDPLPRLHSSHELSGCSVFSRIDLVRACHQIPVAEEDVPKTAAITSRPVRVPHGALRSPQRRPDLPALSQHMTRGLEGSSPALTNTEPFSDALNREPRSLPSPPTSCPSLPPTYSCPSLSPLPLALPALPSPPYLLPFPLPTSCLDLPLPLGPSSPPYLLPFPPPYLLPFPLPLPLALPSPPYLLPFPLPPTSCPSLSPLPLALPSPPYLPFLSPTSCPSSPPTSCLHLLPFPLPLLLPFLSPHLPLALPSPPYLLPSLSPYLLPPFLSPNLLPFPPPYLLPFLSPYLPLALPLPPTSCPSLSPTLALPSTTHLLPFPLPLPLLPSPPLALPSPPTLALPYLLPFPLPLPPLAPPLALHLPYLPQPFSPEC